MANPVYHVVLSGHIIFVTLYPVLFGCGCYFATPIRCICTYAVSGVYLEGLMDTVYDIEYDLGKEDKYSHQLLANYMTMMHYVFPFGLMTVSLLLADRKGEAKLLFFLLLVFVANKIIDAGQQAILNHWFRSGAGLEKKLC